MKSIRCELMNRERSCSQIDKIQTQNDPLSIQRALIVREPYAGMIVFGTKTWEIRGSNTKIRGIVGIIAGGTGTVIGMCDLVDVRGPLSLEEYKNSYKQRGLSALHDSSSLPYNQTYAWVMENARAFDEPVPYLHPNGAVIWVKFSR